MWPEWSTAQEEKGHDGGAEQVKMSDRMDASLSRELNGRRMKGSVCIVN
jgi:hypothetical protein